MTSLVKWKCGHRRKPITDTDVEAAKTLPCLDCFVKFATLEIGYPPDTVERWLQRAGRI